jgi:hypothetical protein
LVTSRQNPRVVVEDVALEVPTFSVEFKPGDRIPNLPEEYMGM